MSTVRDRVEKGAALLDKHVPGWHRTIDLKTLDIASCDDCVCGQVARAIYYGNLKANTTKKPSGFNSMLSFLKRKMGYRLGTGPSTSEIATQHGFDTFKSGHSYGSLDREWGRLIRARLKEEARAA